MSTRIFLIVAICILATFGQGVGFSEANIIKRDLVVLVHGLGRSGTSMWLIENRLQKKGYETCTVDYKSGELDLKTIVNSLHTQLEVCFRDLKKEQFVHFITHSMGGPLVRAYLEKHEINQLGRVAMLSPPNSGSPLVEIANNYLRGPDLLGPTASQLHMGKGSWLTKLPRPNYEIGIIGGNFTFNPFAAYILPGEDDGAVPLTHMRIEGMADFTSVTATHVTIRYSKLAFQHAITFLKEGHFRD